MKRRNFVKSAGLGAAASAAAGTMAAPAIAQSQPEIKWRLAASWPKSLDTLFGGAEYLAKRVAEATDNKFQIRAFAGGEIVPALQVLDAVQNSTVELGHTASYYYVGKDPTFAFDCTVPFGLNARQQNAWMHARRRGRAAARLLQGLQHLSTSRPAIPGPRWAAGYRKEIKTVEDLKGLKFRIGGLAGAVLTKLGVVPQQIAGGDIYPGAREGHHRRGRMGRPLRRREARLLQGRQILLLPRLVGGHGRSSRSTSISSNGTSCRRPTRRCSRRPPPRPWAG